MLHRGLLALSLASLLFLSPVSSSTQPPESQSRVIDTVRVEPPATPGAFRFKAPERVERRETIVVKGHIGKKWRDKFRQVYIADLDHGGPLGATAWAKKGRFTIKMNAGLNPVPLRLQLTAQTKHRWVYSKPFTVQVGIVPAGDPNDWTYVAEDHRTFDPCSPILWSFDGTGGYEGAEADTAEAFRRVSEVSGLTFTRTVDSSTADITVRFATKEQYPLLADSVVAFASIDETRIGAEGAAWVERVSIVMESNLGLSPGFEAGEWHSAGAVFTHEIGHAVGLGHAGGRFQNMASVLSHNNRNFGAGDLTGFRVVGAGRACAQ